MFKNSRSNGAGQRNSTLSESRSKFHYIGSPLSARMSFILLHYLLSFVTVTSSAHQRFLCRVISSSAAISVPHSVRVQQYYRPPGGGGGPSLGDRPPGGGGGTVFPGVGKDKGGGGYLFLRYNPGIGPKVCSGIAELAPNCLGTKFWPSQTPHVPNPPPPPRSPEANYRYPAAPAVRSRRSIWGPAVRPLGLAPRRMKRPPPLKWGAGAETGPP